MYMYRGVYTFVGVELVTYTDDGAGSGDSLITANILPDYSYILMLEMVILMVLR